MVKFFFYAFFVVFLVQKGNSEQQHKDFDDVLSNTKKVLDNFAKEVREKVGISENPSGEEIVRVFKEHNDKMVQDLKSAGKKLEEQIKSNPELQSTLEKVKEKFNEEAEKLKKSNPDLVANAESLGKSLQETWDSVTQEVEKAFKEFNKEGGKREEFEHQVESLFDKMKAGAKQLEEKLEEINKKSRR